MTKLELLYQELLKKEVVRYREIEEIASEIIEKQTISFRYLYNEYINKLRRQGKLLHPQRGLYVAVPLTMIDNDSFQPDRYLIASKIKSPYYLGYHTALELYGCAYSSYNEVYIVVSNKRKFRGFDFKQIRYRPAFTLYPMLGVKSRLHKHHEIQISSPGRTFIDCIDRPEYAGGWEECLKSLEALSGVSSEELRHLLEKIGKDKLFRKTGYILSLLSENPYYAGILDDLHQFLEKHIGESPMYLSEGVKSTLDKRWKLYVPFGFEELIRGI